MSDWLIYRGTGDRHPGVGQLPDPPSWRKFDLKAGKPPVPAADAAGWTPGDVLRASSYRPHPKVLPPVNAALYLRRPLLVTGKPGVGKSTLAYAVAYELGLGPVLRWPITSRSSLQEGLYHYDAIGRLQDVNMNTGPPDRTQIGRYIRLGPLGMALLPQDTPRVLLIDELDKADIDLPNDMLSVFEEGEYQIPELVRLADVEPRIKIGTATGTSQIMIIDGRVRCRQFPVVVMTSNAERAFPPAFLRRCIQLDIEPPSREELAAIVEARLGPDMSKKGSAVIDEFHQRAQAGQLATDQLLNAIHLTCLAARDNTRGRDELVELLLRRLDPTDL